MQTQTLTGIDPHRFFDLRSTSDNGAFRLETGITGVTASSEFSGRLIVRTAEGDSITLGADLDTSFHAGRFYAHGGSGQQEVGIGAEYSRYSLQREFGIAVDGDLNEQELSDLHTLVQKISGIFHGFVEGQDEQALAQTAALAERFGQLTTLSSLDLSVEVLRSVTVVAASAYTPGGAPVTAAVIPLLSNGTTAPTPSLDSQEDGGLSVLGRESQLESLIQQVFDALKEAETELQKFQRYLPDFFEQLHKDLLGRLDGSPKSKEEEQASSTISNQSLVTAYSSVDLDTLSFSIQG
ncbi:MAG: hypothetical protein CV089_08355 [Nitrospira sp. WS110]|nr:hypothetical protein [Nitrospira sp. WS110]